MSTRFQQPGHRRDFTAAADIASGGVAVIRSGTAGVIGVAEVAIANGATGTVQVSGVHRLPKATGQAWTNGALIYWDATAGNATTTSTSNTLAGEAAAAAASGDTEGDVLLNGRPGSALSD